MGFLLHWHCQLLQTLRAKLFCCDVINTFTYVPINITVPQSFITVKDYTAPKDRIMVWMIASKDNVNLNKP
jgi:hypothetical protein